MCVIILSVLSLVLFILLFFLLVTVVILLVTGVILLLPIIVIFLILFMIFYVVYLLFADDKKTCPKKKPTSKVEIEMDYYPPNVNDTIPYNKEIANQDPINSKVYKVSKRA